MPRPRNLGSPNLSPSDLKKAVTIHVLEDGFTGMFRHMVLSANSKEARSIVREAASIIAKQARINANAIARTGLLGRASIWFGNRSKYINAYAVMNVTKHFRPGRPRASYAALVEFGKKGKPGRYYFRRAVADKQTEALNLVETKMDAIMRRVMSTWPSHLTIFKQVRK